MEGLQANEYATLVAICLQIAVLCAFSHGMPEDDHWARLAA
jgi:hypothetical protein